MQILAQVLPRDRICLGNLSRQILLMKLIGIRIVALGSH